MDGHLPAACLVNDQEATFQDFYGWWSARTKVSGGTTPSGVKMWNRGFSVMVFLQNRGFGQRIPGPATIVK
jgi:hypothetical protein